MSRRCSPLLADTTSARAQRTTCGPRVSEVARLAQRAREEGRVGIDTEFMPEGRYKPLLCLIQLAVSDEIVVLDPITDDEDFSPLAEVLADPEVEIVLHAGRQDVAILRREWNTDINNVFDTQVAAGFAGFAAQAGYGNLLADVLGVRLNKTASFTRWDARPLSEEQLSYAREDVEHLLALSDEIKQRLQNTGRLEWAREECLVLAEASDERNAQEVWRRLPRALGLSARDRAVAQELAAWREETARCEDRPVGSIVRDPTLLELIKRQPRDVKAMNAIRGINPDVVRRRGKDIVAAIERGHAAPPLQVEKEDRVANDQGDGPVIALAEALVRQRALEAGLAYELIAARADLSPIVACVRRGLAEPAVRTLSGWRRELVGAELLELLRGNRTLGVSSDGRVEITNP